MKIFPAIDLLGGKAVRLFQGDYNAVTVYSGDPVCLAGDFYNKGATNLHIVDLDGAKSGSPVNFSIIKKIVENTRMSVEVGGGIRDEERVAGYLELGVARVILGTAAIEDFGFLREMIRKYGGGIAVSIDVREGRVAIKGWSEVTGACGFDFCRKLREAGVETVIYKDISRDGALAGTNLEAYCRLSEIKGINIIASGGISYESEISELRKKCVYGAIIGKALYSGNLDLRKVIELGEE